MEYKRFNHWAEQPLPLVSNNEWGCMSTQVGFKGLLVIMIWNHPILRQDEDKWVEISNWRTRHGLETNP